MNKRLHQGTMIPIILMTMLFFMACGNAGEPQISDEPLPVENDDDQLPSHDQLTNEDFIHDFDFMMQTMEDTFPYFGVAERILGVDIAALGSPPRLVTTEIIEGDRIAYLSVSSAYPFEGKYGC